MNTVMVMNKTKFGILLFSIVFTTLYLVSCKKDSTNPIRLATLETNDISSIKQVSAKCGGNISDDGGSKIITRGICWDIAPNPTVNLDTKTTDGEGTGSFYSFLTELTPSTTYYVRAYATNSIGTAYGNLISFTSAPAETSKITTTSISNITHISAVSGGNITSDGYSPIIARGICWNTEPNPTIDLETKTSDGSGIGSFTSNISGLTKGTKYYVRAYATNAIGTAYGNNFSFTSCDIPTITTVGVSRIRQEAVQIDGTIASNGGLPILTKGVCWGTSENPTIDSDSKIFTYFEYISVDINNLTPGITYHARIFASNAAGIAYGNDISFTTIATPSVSTRYVDLIWNNSQPTATGGGSVISEGASPVLAKGVCWSTTNNPTIDLETKTIDGSGIGSFTSSITGLAPNTKYYVRAYATNSNGTSYGGQMVVNTYCVYNLAGNYNVHCVMTRSISGEVTSYDWNENIRAIGVSEYRTEVVIYKGYSTTPAGGTDGFTFNNDCGVITVPQQNLLEYYSNIVIGTAPGTFDSNGKIHLEYSVSSTNAAGNRNCVVDYVKVP